MHSEKLFQLGKHDFIFVLFGVCSRVLLVDQRHWQLLTLVLHRQQGVNHPPAFGQVLLGQFCLHDELLEGLDNCHVEDGRSADGHRTGEGVPGQPIVRLLDGITRVFGRRLGRAIKGRQSIVGQQRRQVSHAVVCDAPTGR